MKKIMTGLYFICFFTYSNSVFSSNDAVSVELESILAAHVMAASKDSESITDLMETLHTDSPVSMHLKAQMEQVFPAFDLNVSLVEFSFVGLSGEYAIARTKQKLEKISGPASFKSHVNKQIIVFKQSHGQWKIWQMTMLDMEYL